MGHFGLSLRSNFVVVDGRLDKAEGSRKLLAEGPSGNQSQRITLPAHASI